MEKTKDLETERLRELLEEMERLLLRQDELDVLKPAPRDSYAPKMPTTQKKFGNFRRVAAVA